MAAGEGGDEIRRESLMGSEEMVKEKLGLTLEVNPKKGLMGLGRKRFWEEEEEVVIVNMVGIQFNEFL